jgi:hypothetical protein
MLPTWPRHSNQLYSTSMRSQNEENNYDTMFRMSTCNSRSRRRKFIDTVATRAWCISKTSIFGSMLHQCLIHFHPHGQCVPCLPIHYIRRRFGLQMKKTITIQCSLRIVVCLLPSPGNSHHIGLVRDLI